MTPRHFAWQDVAGMALGLRFAWQALRDIHVRFAWQVWHLVTSTLVLHGRRGTWSHSPSFCVAGAALMASCWLRYLSHTIFVTHNFHTPSVTHHLFSFHVAGVALGDIYLHLAWQAWHLLHLAARLVALGCPGRRASLPGRRGTWRHLLSFHVAGVVQGDIHLHFTWQAWHKVTSTFVSRGRRGTWRHLLAFHLAGVALGDIYFRFAWQAWYRLHLVARFLAVGRRWSPLVARGAAPLCVAGVALGDIHLCFAWQAWHLAARLVAVGRRESPLVARGAAPLYVAGVAQGDTWQGWHSVIRFTWQAWHLATSTFVLRGRLGTGCTWWRAWSPLVAWGAAPLCVAGVAQGDIHLHVTWQAWHLVTSTSLSRGRRGTWRHPPFTHHL